MEETRKEKIKGNIIVLIMMGLYLGITGYFGYLTGSSSGTKEKLKKECETFKKTTGLLEYSYDQTTISKGHLEVDVNEFHYTYIVDGREYTANETSLNDKPKTNIEIWYDSTNPSINETKDPCKEYTKVKDEKEGKYIWVLQLLGILAALLIIYNVFSLIKNLIMLGGEAAVKKFSKKKNTQNKE